MSDQPPSAAGAARTTAPKSTQDASSSKLGTFSGAFVPTTLNIFSILIFLRFSFIIGQTGVLGFLGMLIVCYLLDIITTTSISAIATNGTVRGGGAYYLVSRTLGPEFGGAIGIVYYLGCVFNTGMNSVGLINCVIYNFGISSGAWRHWLPESFWWSYLWATFILVLCTSICLAGSKAFSKTSNGLLIVLLVAILSIPISALAVKPFEDPQQKIKYTGISLDTLKSNLYPNFTKGADGSNRSDRESWQSLFGVLFPATAGIFAGSSMSGDLKKPSKSIPQGTFLGLAFTFVIYNILLLSLGSTVTRQTMYDNANLVQYISLSGTIIFIGEFATTFFGALMGIIGSSKLLQALARDNLLPGLTIFGKGSGSNDEPRNAIIITYAIAQCTMILDLNQIAGLVTMAYLLTFLVTNLACFTLRVGGAPNFRPAFRLFSWQSAAIGAIISCGIMIFVDSVSALGCVSILTAIFLVIHYTSPPKAWGDVSQSLIFHQVRKYLLRLRKEHVKFWRPSVLLMVNDPRKNYKLIQFCNSLKKGGLFVLGHAIVTEDFKGATAELKKQKHAWNKYIDFSKIKAFTNVTVSPQIEWGIRNLVLNSGLGTMRPNIVMLGFFNLQELHKSKPLIDVSSPKPPKILALRPEPERGESSITVTQRRLRKSLPTDSNRTEGAISAQSYVTVLEDLIRGMKTNVAIAKGFDKLEIPEPSKGMLYQLRSVFKTKPRSIEKEETRYIDLWPVQMSAFAFVDTNDHEQKRVLTTNFDTYTMILQLGSILATAEGYSSSMTLRVSAFVEYENEVEQERQRVQSLLSSIRIQAEVRVFWLASGDLHTYEVIVNGAKGDRLDKSQQVANETLRDESWWQDVSSFRKDELSALKDLAELDGGNNFYGGLPSKPRRPDEASVRRLQRLLRKAKKRISKGQMNELSSQMRVQLSHLDPDLIAAYDSPGSSEDEASEIGSTPSSITPSAIHSPIGMSVGRGRGQSPSRTADLRRPGTQDRTGSVNSFSSPITIQPQGIVSDTAMLSSTSPRSSSRASGVYSPRSGANSPRRPPPMRHQSLPKFTSSPVPATKIMHEEGTGRSIMFVEPHEDDDPSSHDEHRSVTGVSEAGETDPLPPPGGFPAFGLTRSFSGVSVGQPMKGHTPPASNPSIASSAAVQGAQAASGFPSQQAMPLSFNDLPSRAQHLILNDMVAQNSDRTAVIFTTLPAPPEGTGESEADSLKYLSDLEVLCQGLPPTVLVHSNTVTVTVSL